MVAAVVAAVVYSHHYLVEVDLEDQVAVEEVKITPQKQSQVQQILVAAVVAQESIILI
jgi:hypothetical protein